MSRSPERTEKIRFWRRPDPDLRPHNHPWLNPETGESFRSRILSGGYSEEIFWFDEECLNTSIQHYRAGDENIAMYHYYHRVFDILPGTVTHFVTEAVVECNVWHYLEDGELCPPVPKDDYMKHRDAVNPR